jgi:hypothetical protein
MPTLEMALLLQFIAFTSRSKLKLVISCACAISWIALAIVQILFDVYRTLEWFSIALWSIETFPQVSNER